RPRPPVRGAEEPQALPPFLPRPRDLLRARHERDPGRPRGRGGPAEHDRRGTVQRAGRHLERGARDLRSAAPGSAEEDSAMKALTFLARRFVAGETPQEAIEAGEGLPRPGP